MGMHHRHVGKKKKEWWHGESSDANKYFHSEIIFLFSYNRNYSPAIPRIPRVSPETVILREQEMAQVLHSSVSFNEFW